MQPYFLPYIGYFQLINAVDEFVIYDNIQFTKRGWFHRNRILENDKDVYFSLPIEKDSNYLDVKQRFLSEQMEVQKKKILAKIENNYRKAPFFKEVYPIVQGIFNFEEKNLFFFIYNSVKVVTELLQIDTHIIVSSTIALDHDLKNVEKVKAIVKARQSEIYINPIGGKELYDHKNFKNDAIELQFLKTKSFIYEQFGNEFIPFLSIIDVLMFNELEVVKKSLLNEYTIE